MSVETLYFLIEKQMSNRQVALARALVKRQSENWTCERTRCLSVDDQITKSQLKCRKFAWKCFSHCHFNCATIERAHFDLISKSAIESSGSCNCDGPAKEELESVLQPHIRELAKTVVKARLRIAPDELRNILVGEVTSGESAAQHQA